MAVTRMNRTIIFLVLAALVGTVAWWAMAWRSERQVPERARFVRQMNSSVAM